MAPKILLFLLLSKYSPCSITPPIIHSTDLGIFIPVLLLPCAIQKVFSQKKKKKNTGIQSFSDFIVTEQFQSIMFSV